MKEAILELLEIEMSDIEPMFIHGHRIFNEFQTNNLLIQFDFEDIVELSPGLRDVFVTIKTGDETETIVYADDVPEVTLLNLISIVGLEQFARDLDLMV